MDEAWVRQTEYNFSSFIQSMHRRGYSYVASNADRVRVNEGHVWFRFATHYNPPEAEHVFACGNCERQVMHYGSGFMGLFGEPFQTGKVGPCVTVPVVQAAAVQTVYAGG